MKTDKETWKTIERPGYFGKKRDEIIAINDNRKAKAI
jgi:hypothetical protein